MQSCGPGAGDQAYLNKEMFTGKIEPQLLMNAKETAQGLGGAGVLAGDAAESI